MKQVKIVFVILIFMLSLSIVNASENLTTSTDHENNNLTGLMENSVDIDSHDSDFQVNPSSFIDLKNLIDSSEGSVDLNHDYAYNASCDSSLRGGVPVLKNISINGNGHTIDGKGVARIFLSNDNSFTSFYNITFINGRSSDSGGAVSVKNSVFSYCTFISNYCKNYGGAIYADSSNITHCVFINNSINNANGGSSINFNSGNCNVEYSYFENSKDNYRYINSGHGQTAGNNYNYMYNVFLKNPVDIRAYTTAKYNWWGYNCLSYSNFPCLNVSLNINYLGKINAKHSYVFNISFVKSDTGEIVEIPYSFPVNIDIGSDIGNYVITGDVNKNITWENDFSINIITVKINNQVLNHTYRSNLEIGTFTELNNIISKVNEDTIYLARDYKFNPLYDTGGINVSKSITIYGNAHSIDADGNNVRIFNIYSENVVLSNMTFKNSHLNSPGNAVLAQKPIRIEYCSFMDNWAYNSIGGALNLAGGDSHVLYSSFTGNKAKTGGAIIVNSANNHIQYSYFKDNAKDYGDKMEWGSDISITDGQSAYVNYNVLLDYRPLTQGFTDLYYNNYYGNNALPNSDLPGELSIPNYLIPSFDADYVGKTDKFNYKFKVTFTRSDTGEIIDLLSVKYINYIINDDTITHYISTGSELNWSSIWEVNNIIIKVGDHELYKLFRDTSIPGTFKDLNSIISSVNNGGVVELSRDYIFNSTVDKNTITISKSITVNGKGHTIDVNGGSIRIFTVSANNVVLENIIFRNGVSSFGGAISFNSIAKVINCTFINNSARYGGAINIGSGVEVNIIGSNFTSNVASLGGGAVYSWGGSVNVINSTFNYCVSVYGGAILSLEGNLIVNNTKFNNNQAFDFGGGIYKQSTKLTINQGYFHNNSAYYDGGGVYISHGTTNIKNTLFTSNIAGYGGGAIHSLAGTLKLNDSIFADNTSYTNNGWIDTPYLNSFIDFGNYTLVVANTSNYNGTLPSYFSLRDNGWDTKVKNQGSLGICWDYAVIATVETAIKKATGVEVDLSESNLKNLISKYSIYGNNRNPNNGAYQWEASSYLACSLGPVLESLDPTGSFGFSPLLDNAYHISNIALASRSHYSFLDNNKIKEAVIKYGAVRASIKMDTHKGYNYYTKDTDTNHAVAIVGWDDNYAASNFPDGCPGNGAWIVKNSWGASSGKKGYIYVSYYDKSFAWDTLSYIIFNDTIKYDRVYQYDYRNYNWRYTSSSIWYKNTYTSVKNEFITAFSTYFYGKNNWEVQIYVNDELKHTQKGSSIGSGYFTFNLDKIIPVAKGEKFTIVFKVEKGGLPYVKKNLITKSCGAGVSYYSKDGVNWYDLNNDNQVACLKVFTTICNLPGSLVSVNPITNVTYNSQVIVNFNVENRTAVNYYVSKNGQVVCSENNITNNQIKLSNLDVGEYTITIKNQHGTKYMGDVKSVKFTINKASSSIYIDDIDDVVYGNVVNVKFNCLNSTNLSYVVKNKKNNNIVISKKYISNLSNFSIDVLDVGEYIVTIYNDESIHYFKSESSAQFRIIKPTPEISITTTNIIYPGKVSVGVKSNVIGTYTVSVGDKSKTVVLIANKQSNIVFDSLAAGKHTISVKYMQTSNYNSITVNSSVVVLKAQTNVNIKSINTITYPNKASIDFTISNPTTVTYMVKTIDGNVVVENTSLKNINNIILPVLDAGDYIITIANGGSENYSGNSSSAQFTITKATPCVTILTNNLTYSNKIIVSINTTASGSYNVQVGEKIKTVKLTANKINNVEFEGLAVNTYNVLVSCSESNNYKSTSKKGILTISKAKSTINLSPINISCPNDDVICFSINNKTKLSYLIKNSTGIVFNNTNLTTNNITIPVLIPGDYIITIFSEESENYTGVVKNVEFSVEKPDSYIESENINVEYDGNPVIVNISSDYANNISYHLYDFNNCEVLNGTVGVGENIVLTNLNVGYYLINLTTIPDNVHKAVSKQYNINITKSTPMLSISSDNINYTGDLTVCINTTVTGSYMVKVGNQTKNITLNAYEINNIVFYGLSAGDYDVIVYCPQTVNYMSASNNCTVKVFKANFNVDITSVTYPGSVDVNFDNITTTNITYYVKTLSGDLVVSDTNLTNINNFTLPVLAAGEYIITIITEENENYTGEVKSFNFEVEKALSQINSSNITVAYDGNPVLVNVSSENATNITYHVYDHNSKEVLNGTVSVGENIALNNLSAGQYIINLTSGVDGNHSQTSKQYTINITKGNIDLKIQCNNITHNTQILVKIYVNIEGNYTINIDNTYNKTYELKIGENIINDIPLLNIGNYTLNVTGNIKNYESTSKSIKFNIYPKTNPTTNNPTKTKQTINNIKTQFKLLNSKKYTFKKSKNTKKIKVTLQAKNGNILSKVKIIFKFNEKDLKNIKAKNKKGKKLIKQLKKGHVVKSNSKGVATLKLKNKHLTFNKGKYIFNVSFNGQGIYDKSNQNGKITIK